MEDRIKKVLQRTSPFILAINSLTCLFLGISAKSALIAILFLNNNSLWLLHLFQESHIKAVRERALPTVTQHLVREIVSPNQTIRQQVQNPIRLLYFKSRQTFFHLSKPALNSSATLWRRMRMQKEIQFQYPWHSVFSRWALISNVNFANNVVETLCPFRAGNPVTDYHTHSCCLRVNWC